MAACCITCFANWPRARPPDERGNGGSPARRSAAGVRRDRAAVPRKRPLLTHHGGLLHYVLRQLAARKAA